MTEHHLLSGEGLGRRVDWRSRVETVRSLTMPAPRVGALDGLKVGRSVRELLNSIRPSKNQATKVFISYSHQDKSFLKKLAGQLQSQGMKVWWDFEGLKSGQDWQKEIERGIKKQYIDFKRETQKAAIKELLGILKGKE